MQICHGALREEEGNRQENQEDGPEELESPVGLLIARHLAVGVGARDHGNRVKGGCVKGNHREYQEYQHEAIARQGAEYREYGLVEIAALLIHAEQVYLAEQLQAETVVPEHNEGNPGAEEARRIAAQNQFAYGSAAADAADEEGGCDTPDHPVSPVEDGRVLGKTGLSKRVRVGAERDKVLCDIADRGETGLQNVARHAAEEEHIKKERKEKPGAGGRHDRDAVDAEVGADCVDQADKEQNRNGQCRAVIDREDDGDRAGEQGGGDRKGGRRAGNQRKDRNQVNETSGNAVGVLL